MQQLSFFSEINSTFIRTRIRKVNNIDLLYYKWVVQTYVQTYVIFEYVRKKPKK